MKRINLGFILSIAIGVIVGLLILLLSTATESKASECTHQDAYSEVVPGVPGSDAVYETVDISGGEVTVYVYQPTTPSTEAPVFPGESWVVYTGDPHNVRFQGSGHYQLPTQDVIRPWYYRDVAPLITEERLVSEAVAEIPEQTIEHEAIVCPVEETPEVVIPPVEEPVVELPIADIPAVEALAVLESEPIVDIPVKEILPVPEPMVEVAKDVVVEGPIIEEASYPELAYTGSNEDTLIGGFVIGGALVLGGAAVIRLTRKK